MVEGFSNELSICFLNWCILSRTQQYRGSRFYVQFLIILHSLTDKVKKYSYAWVFIEV